MGVAYGVAAWVLLQVADLVLENINAPDWVIQAMMLMVGLGFVAALVIAWAYEMTPEGIRRETDIDRSESITGKTGQKLDRVVIGFLVIAVLVLLYRQSGDAPTPDPNPVVSAQPEATVVAAPPEEPDRKSIAVLPFVNMSSDPEQEYFSDGITEEILNRLAKIPGLQVAARTSVFSFKGQNMDIREVAQILGVSTMLEGSVRRDGEQVRITAQLIRASDGFHLWSETYDRKIESIFAVQDEISTQIATALQVSLGISGSDTSTRSATTNPEVYDLYLRARALHRKRGRGLLEALDLFERAITIDPQYAPAWAGLAHSLNVVMSYVTPEEMERIGDADARSLQAAQRSLELDPDLPMALHAMANNRLAQFRWSEAQEYYEKALARDPDSPDIMEDYGHFLLYSWQIDKAKRVAERIIVLDPLVPVFRFMAARVYETIGNTEKQDEHIRVALEINPDLKNIQYRYLLRLVEQEEYAIAHEYVEQMDLLGMTTPTGLQLLIDWMANSKEQPEELPEELPEGEMLSALEYFPDVARLAGRYKLWLDIVYPRENTQWEGFLIAITYFSPFADETRFKQLHAIPRTKEIMRESRLPEYWREIGWPERCRPIGDDDFECK